MVPPNTAVKLSTKYKAPPNKTFMVNATGFSHCGAMIPNILMVSAATQGEVNWAPLVVRNDSNKFVCLKKGHLVGLAEEVDLVGDSAIGGSILAGGSVEGEKSACSVEGLDLVDGDATGGSNLAGGCSAKDERSAPILESATRAVTKVPPHLHDLWERACNNLNAEQAETLAKVLAEYQDVFSDGEFDLGTFSEAKHKIDTGDARPVRQKMRRTPLGFEKEEKAHLESLITADVIEPSSSEWASPPVLVRKKDGRVRYCIDFRLLNDRTLKDSFPLPSIEECLDVIGNTKFFSTLDMSSGYYQIEIEEGDKHKTAFITKYGLYQYKRMPFGLCNAPATFQRAMSLVLRGLNWEQVLAYLDDIILLGGGFEEALSTLVSVFKRFRQNNLKLKAKKCELFQTEVLFLGKQVTNAGISPAPESVAKVLNWPTPTSSKDVERFTGLANYHRAHIKDFARLANPLYSLTKKKKHEFKWTEEHEQSFIALKKSLTTSPVLAFPRPDGDHFILDTDASDFAIGAELLQIQDGEERLLGFGSYTLSSTQRNYCTTKKELLAVVRFTRQFRHYLLGRKFYVRTDHGSLTWLMRFKNINGMLARWIEELSQYDMVVIHRKGIDHVNADSRSRIPEDIPLCNCYFAGCRPEDLPCFQNGCLSCARIHEQWSRFQEDVDDVIPLSVRQVSTAKSDGVCLEVRDLLGQSSPSNTEAIVIRQVCVSHGTQESDDEMSEDETDNEDGDLLAAQFPARYSSKELHDEQIKDPDLCKIISWKEHTSVPTQQELQMSSPAVKHLWSVSSNLVLDQNVLYYRWIEENGSRLLLLIPKSMRDEVMHYCHNVKSAGHPGITRTFARLHHIVFWPGMREDCKIYVKSCPECSRQKKASRQSRAKLGSFHAGAPVERVHLDILGPFSPSSSGCEYILMLVCQFTKWMEAYPLPDCRAETVARTVVDHFISRFGCPNIIHTDQGSNFTSSLFKSVCELLEITKTRTTPYRPCSNGQVERYNRTLLAIIRCYLKEGFSDWDKDLNILTSAIRSVPNRQTGFTPNMLMLGREVTQPISLVFGDINQKQVEGPEYLRDLRERMYKVHHMAREQICRAQVYQQTHYNKSANQCIYQPGDLVLKFNKAREVGVSTKLLPIYTGPFLVTEVLSSVLIRIRDRRRSQIVHHDLVKKCTEKCIPMWLRRMRSEFLSVGGEPSYDGTPSHESSPSRPDGGAAVGGVPLCVSGPSAGATSDVDVQSTWVQCDACQRWRRVSCELAEGFSQQDPWYCSMNLDINFNKCSIPEEDSSDWVRQLDERGLAYTVGGRSAGVTGDVKSPEVKTRHGRRIKPPSRFC